MSNDLTKKQSAALAKATEYFDYASKHPGTIDFRSKAIEDFGFYDGNGQWLQEDLDVLSERDQLPVTVNIIKGLVNRMSGMEIQTRYRTAFRSHSESDDPVKLAEALTHLSYAIQENQDIPYKSSLKFRDSLITGIGWSNIYKDKSTGVTKYEHVNPINVFYDPDDMSSNFTDMSFVARVRWIPLFKLKQLFPKMSNHFEDVYGGFDKTDNQSGEVDFRQSADDSEDDSSGSRIKVIEVQYRELKKSYKGNDTNGYSFETFSKDNAIKLAGKNKLTEVESNCIMRVLYCGDILLEYEPLHPMLPNLADFTYIPCVWTRRFSDGVPEGWIQTMKGLQRELNVRRTKAVHNINSFRVVLSASSLQGKSEEQIRQEVKRSDSVIVNHDPTSKIDIKSNQDLASGQIEIMNHINKEIQQVSGMYDEALGKQTNAISGVAIKNRQVNSVNNQVFAFDNLKMMKKREARMLLNILQGSGDEFVESHIITDDEKQTILLNIVREINGTNVLFNDIRTIPLSIYVEEVPDYESSKQEHKESLQSVLSNPNAMMILQSKSFLKRLGIRDYEALSDEFKEITQGPPKEDDSDGEVNEDHQQEQP